MAFNFPSSPALNDTYAPVGGPTYRWNGTVWKLASNSSLLNEDAGLLAYFPMTAAPTGWLKANGAAVNLAVYTRLIAIYCGDANNPTALHGYRCTDPLNPSTSRSTSGGYIVVPDGRGEFFRGLDDGRGVDTSRSAWAAQTDAFQGHRHGASGITNTASTLWLGNASNLTPGSGGNGPASFGEALVNVAVTEPTVSGSLGTPRTAAETRPRNIAPLACIRY